MYSVTQTITQYVDPMTKQLSDVAFRDALHALEVRNSDFTNKVLHYMMANKGGDAIDYYDLMNTINEYCCGLNMVEVRDIGKMERWKATVRACYNLFDPLEVSRGYIVVRELKGAKGKQSLNEKQPCSYTFSMLKALLDYCVQNEITQVVLLSQLESEWLTNPSLVFGFIEEVFRLILCEKYAVRRSALYL